MKILGIETSCDETAICLIETEEVLSKTKINILGNKLYSQIAIHKEYGGVFPILAKREHQKNLIPLLIACLEEAGLFSPLLIQGEGLGVRCEEAKIKITALLNREAELLHEFLDKVLSIKNPGIDVIAVTNGPGLEPALWVGVNFAKALGYLWNIPVIPTNHMEGHIVISLLSPSLDKEGARGWLIKQFELSNISYPAISLLISGGHTQLVLVKDFLNYEIIGNTRDDAAGEAFDKVARILGLPYPGGPEISKLAQKERDEFPNKITNYPLPRPMIHSKDLDFSFSGLKTAVLYTTQKISELTPAIKQEIAKEFEDAVIDVLISKTKMALEKYGAQTLILGGGVTANSELRHRFTNEAQKNNWQIFIPEISASTDNALMIALAGYLNFKNKQKTDPDFVAKGNLSL